MPPAARGAFEKLPLDPAKLFNIFCFTIFACSYYNKKKK